MACVQGLLEQLNERLEKPLPMNRFRPNIVVTDCKAAAEDGWIEYGIGKDVLVESVKPCDRCTVGPPCMTSPPPPPPPLQLNACRCGLLTAKLGPICGSETE